MAHEMTPAKFRAWLRRRFPYEQIVIQCGEQTTPPELRERGMICAIVTWTPERTSEGELVENGFHPLPEGATACTDDE